MPFPALVAVRNSVLVVRGGAVFAIGRTSVLFVAVALTIALIAGQADAQAYRAIDLFTLTPPSGFIGIPSIDNTTSGPGQIVSVGTAGSGNTHAWLGVRPVERLLICNRQI